MKDERERRIGVPATAPHRRAEAMRLQEIEDNPLDAADQAMFDREGWPHARRRAHIIAHARE
ncbi:MAG: hypothetical protein KDG89_12010 [Geminicoccaceae bacterium]|nr:hypothetical protein [Geminicoccaceae bacterium]